MKWNIIISGNAAVLVYNIKIAAWLKFMVVFNCVCEEYVQWYQVWCLLISISLCISILKYRFDIRSQIPQPIEFILCCFIAHFTVEETDAYHMEVPPGYFFQKDGLTVVKPTEVSSLSLAPLLNCLAWVKRLYLQRRQRTGREKHPPCPVFLGPMSSTHWRYLKAFPSCSIQMLVEPAILSQPLCSLLCSLASWNPAQNCALGHRCML